MKGKEKITFVSAADSSYYPLLREWIHSVRSFGESKGIDICVLNTGMTAEQVGAIRPLVTKVLEIDWPFPPPERKTKGRDYLKACVARPFLPVILPEYDLYIWMDSDTWIQRWDGVKMFMKGAENGKVALTGQVDCVYPRQMRVKWIGRMTRKIMPYHLLLAGAFALRKDAPHWKRWQELVRQAARKGKIFTAEQTALSVLCYLENYPFELLPAWTHWLCEFRPLWNEDTGKFVEPFLPHEEIGVLHLSGVDEMRENRAAAMDFRTLQGETVHLSCRYPDFDGEAGKEISKEPPPATEVPRGELRIADKNPL